MSNLPSRTRSLRKPADKVDDLNGVDRSSTQSPSRLPVKGATSTRPRPLSLSSTTSLLSNVSSGPASASMRPPPSRANISKPASSTTGIYRTTSTRRPSPPASSTETAPVKKDRPTSISSLAGLQRASSTRRPNAQLPACDVDPTKAERSTQASTRHLRSGSVHSTLTSTTSRVPPHTRTKSSSTVLSASAAAPPTRTKEETSLRGPLAESQQLRKPAFNTLQQHYSPAKNLAPKPHPAAFLVPPTPSKRPENIAISAETAKLQSELLQLHLLHKEAARTEKEWRISAKRKLGRKFDDVAKEHDNLVRLEEEEIGRINAAALKRWGVGSWGLEEKTQALESVLSGVWNMGEPGGKYTRVVRKFVRWVAKVQDILSSRDKNDLEEVTFIEELDSAWKNDCVMLRRKLEGWSSQLRDLGTPDEGSSLATVVRGCRQLVEGMLDELGVMAQIERDAVRIEGEWIQAMNDDNTDDEDEDRKLRTPGAAWRAR